MGILYTLGIRATSRFQTSNKFRKICNPDVRHALIRITANVYKARILRALLATRMVRIAATVGGFTVNIEGGEGQPKEKRWRRQREEKKEEARYEMAEGKKTN